MTREIYEFVLLIVTRDPGGQAFLADPNQHETYRHLELRCTREVTRMSRHLVIYAPNVHQGGGRTLLLPLLSALPNDTCGEAILDARLEGVVSLPSGMRVTRVRPSVRNRLWIERELPSKALAKSHLFCFHSLPPLRRCQALVSMYVHNRYVISNTDTSAFPARIRLRIKLERMWFRWGMGHIDEFVVQTETMREILRGVVGLAASIRVLPFAPRTSFSAVEAPEDPSCVPAVSSSGPIRYDFCYIATGEPHKNHQRLIDAWCLLAQAGQFPSLCLTLDTASFPELCGWIDDRVRRFGLRVNNVGKTSLDGVHEIYRRSDALIYPSLFESFGLPLLEAREHGLQIGAGELDYVRDVIEPDATFDPMSVRSIARAAQRLLGLGNERIPILDEVTFADHHLFADRGACVDLTQGIVEANRTA